MTGVAQVYHIEHNVYSICWLLIITQLSTPMSRCVYVGVAAASLPPRCVHGTLPTAQNQSLSMSGSSACPVPLQPMQDSRRLVGEGGG